MLGSVGVFVSQDVNRTDFANFLLLSDRRLFLFLLIPQANIWNTEGNMLKFKFVCASAIASLLISSMLGSEITYQVPFQFDWIILPYSHVPCRNKSILFLANESRQIRLSHKLVWLADWSEKVHSDDINDWTKNTIHSWFWNRSLRFGNVQSGTILYGFKLESVVRFKNENTFSSFLVDIKFGGLRYYNTQANGIICKNKAITG